MAPRRPPPTARRAVLLLTCEHGGRRIPARYAALFRGARRVLDSHRGWDPGALPLARRMSSRLGVPLHAVTWSRLLVEANRAIGNPRLWSPWTRALPQDERARILDRYYWPHRQKVTGLVEAAAARGSWVFHLAVHSFTPVFDGVTRTVDVGLLYDPSRTAERRLALAWRRALLERDPALRVRLNQPYLGVTDGLGTWLRKRVPAAHYAAMELEVNHGLLLGPRRAHVERVVLDSFEEVWAREREASSQREPTSRGASSVQ